MALTDILTILQNDTTGTKLSIKAQSFSNKALKDFLNKFFVNGQVDITLSSNVKIDGDTVLAKGKSSLYGLTNATVEARFRIFGTNDNPALNLIVKLPTSWKFTKSFPEWNVANPTEYLEDGEALFLFDELKFSKASLVFESNAQSSNDNQLKKGINFKGAVLVKEPLDELAWFLNGKEKLQLWGAIDKKATSTTMDLNSEIVAGVNIGHLDVDIHFKLVVNNVKPDTGSPYPEPLYEVVSKFDFALDNSTEEIVLTTSFSRIIGLLNFVASFDPISLMDGLTKLSQIFGSAEMDALPDHFPALDNIALTGFSFALMPASNSFVAVSAMVSTLKPWPIVHGVDIESMYLQLTLNNPTTANRKIQANIGGIIDVGDNSQFNISALFPDYVLYAYLTEGHVIPLSNLSDHFQLGDLPKPGHMPDFDITVLEVKIDAKNKSLFFDGKIESNWQIIPDIPSTESLELQLNVQRDDSGSQTSGFLKGDMKIGDDSGNVELTLLAEFEESMVFSGHWTNQSDITIGTMIEYMSKSFTINDSTIPQSLKDLVVEDIAVKFDTGTKDFTFSLETKFSINDTPLDCIIDIEMTHVDNKYNRKFSGIIKVQDLEFDLIFNQSDAESIFLAAFENKSGKDEKIKDLAALVMNPDDIPDAVGNMSFNLKDALLVIDKGTETKVLFGLDIGAGMDISKLPLVGKMLPASAMVKANFQPLISSKAFAKTDLSTVKALVPSGGFILPDEASKGLDLKIKLTIGEHDFDLNLPIAPSKVNTQDPSSTATTTNTPYKPGGSNTAPQPAKAAGIKWFNIQKKLGPIDFQRVGVQYKDSALYFLLDASLSLAGLTLSLDGLYASSKLKPIHPVFGLKGLGLDFKKGTLEIGGAFLHDTVTKNGVTYDVYSGTAIINTGTFALAAMGSYSYYQGHPSLFIYAFLDVPLGGPTFFFVTGLAAGFGYNRKVVMPSIDAVSSFPLVEEAMSGSSAVKSKDDLPKEIRNLNEAIPPSIGEYFLAVGIRFSSFEIIDSFVLLAVSFGNEFELDILGLSTLVLPTPEEGSNVEPLAEIQLALKAVFNPERGYLKIRAGLTPASFLLSRKCHLTGGFAFYVWFKDNDEEKAKAGDFVLTLGGYHPRYKPPPNYPKVDRLGFNWIVVRELIIKGDFYFALVPTAVMAGGHLSAIWKSGGLKAWFKLGIDFIISWKPYYYDAEAYIDLGVSYTFKLFGTHTIKVELGADLHIWGPEFSGKAKVHLWIITFTISFGADANQPKALTWEEFKTQFLPQNKQWLSMTVTNGLIKQTGPTDAPLYVVNPKEFELQTNSALPVNSTTNTVDLSEISSNLNIGSMKIADNALESTHQISIERDGHDVTTDFTIQALKKAVPKALWGDKFEAEITDSDKEMIYDTCSGFLLKGKAAVASDVSLPIKSSLLLNEDENFKPKVTMPNNQVLNNRWLKSKGARAIVAKALEAKDESRNKLLKDLGFTEQYHPNNSIADEFILTTA